MEGGQVQQSNAALGVGIHWWFRGLPWPELPEPSLLLRLTGQGRDERPDRSGEAQVRGLSEEDRAPLPSTSLRLTVKEWAVVCEGVVGTVTLCLL